MPFTATFYSWHVGPAAPPDTAGDTAGDIVDKQL